MTQGQHGGLTDMIVSHGHITGKCSKGPGSFQER
jgi:hypothetical protein